MILALRLRYDDLHAKALAGLRAGGVTLYEGMSGARYPAAQVNAA